MGRGSVILFLDDAQYHNRIPDSVEKKENPKVCLPKHTMFFPQLMEILNGIHRTKVAVRGIPFGSQRLYLRGGVCVLIGVKYLHCLAVCPIKDQHVPLLHTVCSLVTRDHANFHILAHWDSSQSYIPSRH